MALPDRVDFEGGHWAGEVEIVTGGEPGLVLVFVVVNVVGADEPNH